MPITQRWQLNGRNLYESLNSLKEYSGRWFDYKAEQIEDQDNMNLIVKLVLQ